LRCRLPTVWHQWGGKIKTHHGVVYSWSDRRTVHAYVAQIVSPLDTSHPPTRVGREKRGAFAAAVVEILIDLNPDVAKGVGRVVYIPDLNGASELRGAGVEAGGDRVVCALLPVIRPRRAERRAVPIRPRPIDPVCRREGIVPLCLYYPAQAGGRQQCVAGRRFHPHRGEHYRAQLRTRGQRYEQESV